MESHLHVEAVKSKVVDRSSIQDLETNVMPLYLTCGHVIGMHYLLAIQGPVLQYTDHLAADLGRSLRPNRAHQHQRLEDNRFFRRLYLDSITKHWWIMQERMSIC